MERFLTPKQLAEVLSVKPGTIYSWLSRGVNIPHIKVSGTVRFREKAIEAWLLKEEHEKRRRNFEV